ncbi:MAG: FAD-binding oxidoreductase [Candidatus Binatia bacterium]
MSTNGTSSGAVVIVGGGVAGASLAYFLAARGVVDVVLLEREARTAYHASGRSARTLLEIDPNPVVQRLKVLGAEFLRRPPEGFTPRPLLDPRGALRLFRGAGWRDVQSRVDELREAGRDCELISAEEAVDRVGVLEAGTFDGAAYLPEGGFIDVDALLDGYLAAAVAAGVEVRTGEPVLDIEYDAGRVSAVVTAHGRLRARWIVNAAGAWAGELAGMADATRPELVARRRSIAIFPVHEDLAELGVECWPLVWSDPHSVYFRPGFDGLMVCAMDETPSPPCDAVCDERVLEEAMSRLAVLAPRLCMAGLARGSADGTSSVRSWAGLRTFAADGVPVVGEDPRRPGFFWLAGQGGCGIETSGLLGQLASDLITEGASNLFDVGLLTPRRFG